MKKILNILIVVLLATILYGCMGETPKDPMTLAYDQLDIGYTNPDTLSSVTQNITLPTTIEGIANLEITWTSENEEIVSLDGVVVRGVQDVILTLTAHLKLNSVERFKFFTITIIKLADADAPVITGAGDFFLEVGASNIDYLAGVSAFDTVDGDVDVTFDDSKVNLNQAGQYALTYRAEDTTGNETTVTVTVIVSDETALTISEVRNSSDDTELIVEGSVTSKFVTESHYVLYIEDEASSLVVHAPLTMNHSVIFGSKVVIGGTKTTIDGVVVLLDVEFVAAIGTGDVSPAHVNANKLNDYQDKLVTSYGLVSEIHTLLHTTYRLESLTGSLELVIPEHMGEVQKKTIQTKLRSLSIGLGVGVTGVVGKQGSTHYIILTDPELITIEDAVDNAEVLEVIRTRVNLPEYSGVISSNLTLLRNQDLLFGATISYLSSDQIVLSNTGIVSRKEDDTQVSFTYELKFNGETLDTKTFSLVIQGSLIEFSGYYASLDGLSGIALQQGLTQLLGSYTYKSYDSARQILQQTDKDPNNSSNVILIYNRASVRAQWDLGVTWNREHVWPQSFLGTTHEESDLHNLKPANPTINSNRGNSAFRDSVESSYGIVAGQYGGWFPGDDDKGDVARILLYMVTRYTHLQIGTMGIIEQLIKWHIEDPVDQFERDRNDVIYSYQENRNPYIDHPELVHEFWSA